MQGQKANRLIQANSPYLLQHAYNPVEWFEWGEDALQKALQEDKPILVSIGYSSCHWCHVMEKESFENEDVAAVMNEYFVCIKVDREERPDIDAVYMDAVQALGVRGGWPLNVFLTPHQKPFFGGTYFSPVTWVQILQNINKAFQVNRKQIEGSAEELRQHLLRADLAQLTAETLSKDEFTSQLHKTYSLLAAGFDSTWGGLEKAPKFIMPSIWHWMLRYYYQTKNTEALAHTLFTLKKIAHGGIYDTVGGGFARYSVDREWFAPHFEKMLYDNAQLISLYTEAYAITRDEEFKRIVLETFDWLNREMSHAEGGFHSALDADSEGVEGKYYIWTKNELLNLLKDYADLFCAYYHVAAEGNWEHGSNILTKRVDEESFLQAHKLTAEQWQQTLSRCKNILLRERSKRIAPGLDDKIITSWNAMMIGALTDAYRYLGDVVFLNRAVKAWEFVNTSLRYHENLHRSFKGQRSTVHGFLDDYAYVIQAALKLYQVTFDERYLQQAHADIEFVLNNFKDDKHVLFYYTSNTHEALITRKKETFDNVIPASNAVMAQNLWQAATLFDMDSWKEIAKQMVETVQRVIKQEPNYMSHWAIVQAEVYNGLAEVAIVGDDAHNIRKKFQHQFHPFAVTLGSTETSNLPLLQDKTPTGKTTIYVCHNKVCKLPVPTVEEAVKQLL